MSKAKIIVLEGIDGSGKSTQLELIKNYLTKNKQKFAHLHFPMYGHNEFSEVIAKFLQGEYGENDKVDPYFVANIYAMDRYLYLPELQMLMEENDVIILDRYIFSNIAFQCAKYEMIEEKDMMRDWISDLEFKFLKLPYPELTLFLDVSIEIVEERLEKRKDEDRDYLEGKQDIHEADLSFQSKVRDSYIGLKDWPHYHIIKCATVSGDFGDTHWSVLTPEELFNSYKKLIDLNILSDGL